MTPPPTPRTALEGDSTDDPITANVALWAAVKIATGISMTDEQADLAVRSLEANRWSLTGPMAASPSAGLRAALDNLLRHHNAGSDHQPSTNPHLPDCEFARQARAALAALAEPSSPPTGRAYCGDCDGVGWYEGGETLQTQCERCNGTGWADGKP